MEFEESGYSWCEILTFWVLAFFAVCLLLYIPGILPTKARQLIHRRSHVCQLDLVRLYTAVFRCARPTSNLLRVQSRTQEVEEPWPKPWPRPWDDVTYGSRYDPRRDGVIGYPSKGGVLIRSADAVELTWLGLDRFEAAQKSFGRAEEDSFCRRLKMLGAQDFSSYNDWRHQLLEDEKDVLEVVSVERVVDRWEIETGWPAQPWVVVAEDGEECCTGVWIWRHLPLTYQPRTGEERVEQWKTAQKMRLLKLTLNMEERCRIIEKIGGAWYDDWMDCQELKAC